MSVLNTWASRVSFQSTLVFIKAEFSRENSGNAESDEEEGDGKSLKGSQRLRQNGSKMLLPRRELGMRDILEKT